MGASATDRVRQLLSRGDPRAEHVVRHAQAEQSRLLLVVLFGLPVAPGRCVTTAATRAAGAARGAGRVAELAQVRIAEGGAGVPRWRRRGAAAAGGRGYGLRERERPGTGVGSATHVGAAARVEAGVEARTGVGPAVGACIQLAARVDAGRVGNPGRVVDARQRADPLGVVGAGRRRDTAGAESGLKIGDPGRIVRRRERAEPRTRAARAAAARRRAAGDRIEPALAEVAGTRSRAERRAGTVEVAALKGLTLRTLAAVYRFADEVVPRRRSR